MALPAVKPSPAEAALRRRLAAGTPEPDDLRALERARRLRELRSEGKSFTQCSDVMEGEDPKSLSTWSRGRIYATLCEYLELGEIADLGAGTEKVLKQARADLAMLAPENIKLYRECFARDASGKLLSKADAQWASDRVAKGTGLAESGSSARPIVVIPLADIRAAMGAIRADDRSRPALPLPSVTVTELTPALPAPTPAVGANDA